ncbi:hypothetical protein L484_011270 [Morus notabilis]|uniref:Uncharacterized protein n=1 Tax=Morus notabilis TaxID=981085 RepID=W9RQP6_9ROSA|nr:hypothetical protein L484_011270 [Morus notabilis]
MWWAMLEKILGKKRGICFQSPTDRKISKPSAAEMALHGSVSPPKSSDTSLRRFYWVVFGR